MVVHVVNYSKLGTNEKKIIILLYTEISTVRILIYLLDKMPTTTMLHKKKLMVQLKRVDHLQVDDFADMRVLIN